MNNLLQLQRQCAKKNLPLLILMWVLTILIWGLTLGSGDSRAISSMFLEIAITLLTIGLTVRNFVLPMTQLSSSLNRLPAADKDKINAECLSGLQFGQAIITDSGYLISMAGGRANVILPRDIIWVYMSKMTTSYVTSAAAVASQSSLIVVDRSQKKNTITTKTQPFAGRNMMKQADAQAFIEKMSQTSPGAFYGYSKENQDASRNFAEMVKTVDQRNIDSQFVR